MLKKELSGSEIRKIETSQNKFRKDKAFDKFYENLYESLDVAQKLNSNSIDNLPSVGPNFQKYSNLHFDNKLQKSLRSLKKAQKINRNYED